jgi:hypothetical protein
MMDFDELLSDNHSLSINQINHSSDCILFAGVYLVHFNRLLLLAPISIEGGVRTEPEIIAWA